MHNTSSKRKREKNIGKGRANGSWKHDTFLKHRCQVSYSRQRHKREKDRQTDTHNWIPTCLRVDQNTSRWYACRFQGKQKEATARRRHLPTYATIKGKRATSADSWIDGRCAMRRLAESCDWKRLLGVRKRTRG